MSLGGGMTSNPLLVGWTDGNTPRVSVRYVTLVFHSSLQNKQDIYFEL